MNSSSALSRRMRLVVLALPPAILGALALVLFWGEHLVAKVASASSAPSVDMSMVVKGGRGDCTTKDGNNGQCRVLIGGSIFSSDFTVSVFINGFSKLPEDDSTPDGEGYLRVQVRLNHTTGLNIKGRDNVREFGPDANPFWPDCGVRDESSAPKADTTPSYLAGCAISSSTPSQESTYTGRVLEVDFECKTKGKQTITLKHGSGDSLIRTETGTIAVDAAGTESITVDCLNLAEFLSEGFKCYQVTAAQPALSPRPVVTLLDQFEQRESRLLAPVSFCNVARKDSDPFFDPTAHLTCYSIEFLRTEPAFRRRDVFVLDQFGSRRLTLTRPSRLCEPSEKNAVASDFGLRLKCYKVRGVSPSFAAQSVQLADQFGSKSSLIVKPVSYCTAVRKTALDGTVFPAIDNQHLVCYAVDQETTSEQPATDDQFGSRTLTLGRVDSYCGVAFKATP